MPREVEHAYRHATIDDPHGGKLCRQGRRHAILPRTRERGECIAAGLREGAGDLMNVFADAGAGPEGRTVIDDDPHAAETITTGPYPCWSTGWKDILAGASHREETIKNENCGRWIRLRRPGAWSLPGGDRQRRHLYRQGRSESPHATSRRGADLRTGSRRD